MHRKDAHANVTPMLTRGKQFGPFAGYKEKNWIRPLILWSLHKLVDYLVLHWGLTLLAEWSNTPYEYVEWLLAWGYQHGIMSMVTHLYEPFVSFCHCCKHVECKRPRNFEINLFKFSKHVIDMCENFVLHNKHKTVKKISSDFDMSS